MSGTKKSISAVAGSILEEEVVLNLADVCRVSQLSAERVISLVEEGIVQPLGDDPERWRFRAVSLRRIRCAQRLQDDLGINTPGAALVLDLLDELEHLRARLGHYEA